MIGPWLLVAGVALGAGRDRPPVRDLRPAGPSGPALTQACPGVTTIWVAAQRPGIPVAASPYGSCASPGLLPIRIEALVLDADGAPVPDCSVLFYQDPSEISNCGRMFGESCPPGVTATTDASGIARIEFTMTQADLDFCNCLPSRCHCLRPGDGDCDLASPGVQTGIGLCPNPAMCAAAPTCPAVPSADLFCQVAFRATAAGVDSRNAQILEYGWF